MTWPKSRASSPRSRPRTTPMAALRDRILDHFSEECDEGRPALGRDHRRRDPQARDRRGRAADGRDDRRPIWPRSSPAITDRRGRRTRSRATQGQCQLLVMLVKAMAMRTAQCGPASPALAAQVVAVDRPHPDRHLQRHSRRLTCTMRPTLILAALLALGLTAARPCPAGAGGRSRRSVPQPLPRPAGHHRRHEVDQAPAVRPGHRLGPCRRRSKRCRSPP